MGVNIKIYAGQGIQIGKDIDRVKVLSTVFDHSSTGRFGGVDFKDMDEYDVEEAWFEFWDAVEKRDEFSTVSFLYSGMSGDGYLMENCVEVFNIDSYDGVDMVTIEGDSSALQKVLDESGIDTPIKSMVVVTYN